MPRYLLQQWTGETIQIEDDEEGSHGLELWATPSSSSRLLELAPNDEVYVAGVVDGRLLPICRLVVGRVASREELVAEGHTPYDLPFQAIATPPLPRMNLRAIADEALSLAVMKESGEPLARRKSNPRQIDGQAFRTPQWIARDSANRLSAFLDAVWAAERDEGVDDPVRVSRGLAPKLTPPERKAIEQRAMAVVTSEYERRGYILEDVSGHAPWDLTAVHPDGDVAHIEVKGTTGEGRAITVTAGERRHAEEFAHPVLAIVTGIALDKGRPPKAGAGELRVHLSPWAISDGTWSATVFRYEPPGK
ncbi:MAG: DUF3883 domain-containing protein [Solirubrobacteraceae bacterium]